MMQSASPSDDSLCQTRRAEWPSWRSAWTASWSQLLAGNCRKAKFILRVAVNGLRGKCGQTDGDVFRAFCVGRAVLHPFAAMRDDGLSGANVERFRFRFHPQHAF